MFIAAFLILAIALVILWVSSRQERKAGLPGGKVIYTDTRSWGRLEAPLYSARLKLTGKPDYLVRQGEQIIPVEVKSTRATGRPLDGHIYQLAAYCLLVHEHFGVRPAHGIIHYPNRTYQIDFTLGLENEIRLLLDELQAAERQGEQDRSHESRARCDRCGFRSICDQRLG